MPIQWKKRSREIILIINIISNKFQKIVNMFYSHNIPIKPAMTNNKNNQNYNDIELLYVFIN